MYKPGGYISIHSFDDDDKNNWSNTMIGVYDISVTHWFLTTILCELGVIIILF